MKKSFSHYSIEFELWKFTNCVKLRIGQGIYWCFSAAERYEYKIRPLLQMLDARWFCPSRQRPTQKRKLDQRALSREGLKRARSGSCFMGEMFLLMRALIYGANNLRHEFELSSRVIKLVQRTGDVNVFVGIIEGHSAISARVSNKLGHLAE